MGLGGKSKKKKGVAIQVDYIVHVQEIRPWPPSDSLRSIESVLLQWENGEQNSGFLTANVEEDSIEFNKSFTLFLTIRRDKKDPEKFHKNYMEFFLYESPKEMADKGQLLGTVLINFADYGIIQQILTISLPMNCKKTSKSFVQPSLFVKIQPVYKDPLMNSPNIRLSVSTDGQESVADFEDDDPEVSGFTDEDSWAFANSVFEAAWNSPARNEKSDHESSKGTLGRNVRESAVPYGSLPRLSSMIVSQDMGPSKNQNFPKFPERSMTLVQKSSTTPLNESTFGTNWKSEHGLISFGLEKLAPDFTMDDLKKEHQNYGQDEQALEGSGQLSDGNIAGKGVMKRQSTMKSIKSILGGHLNNGRLKNVKSIQVNDSSSIIGLLGGSQNNERAAKEQTPEDTKTSTALDKKEPRNKGYVGKKEWESKVEMLEEELREAAAIEFGLYSVVAEHGSSINKLHAPARRLSRLYFHAFSGRSPAKHANAARAAVSGLIVVTKACGNDVTRLTFWLSNVIMLRAIVSETDGGSPESNVGGKGRSPPEGRSSHKRRDDLSKAQKNTLTEESCNWEDKETFITALENIEAWIFSRIVKSVWWQTLTPRMQPSAAKTRGRKSSRSRKNVNSRKISRNKHELGDQEQSKSSVKLWKKAFKDARERLCPIRAGGHECGCLPMLAKLVMEQLVSKLDMAMFNAILRGSGEEMATDPISDPISDPAVLPIPAGKSSFGAGAQLKNAIQTWSKCLADFFGIEDHDSPETNNPVDGKPLSSYKAFHLLNSLSDLMMLPFGMLVDVTTRKEVCPTFGPPLIKRVLGNFVPDEFSPKPIPQNVIAALDSEDPRDASGGCLTSFPCTASAMLYSPPSPASLVELMQEVVGSQALRKGSPAVLKKSYTSDDELTDLDSPLTSIIVDNLQKSKSLAKSGQMAKGKGFRNVVRYQLLREVLKGDEQ